MCELKRRRRTSSTSLAVRRLLQAYTQAHQVRLGGWAVIKRLGSGLVCVYVLCAPLRAKCTWHATVAAATTQQTVLCRTVGVGYAAGGGSVAPSCYDRGALSVPFMRCLFHNLVFHHLAALQVGGDDVSCINKSTYILFILPCTYKSLHCLFHCLFPAAGGR